VPIPPSNSTPVLLSYIQLDKNHTQSIPTAVANLSITESTSWKSTTPRHRDSLVVRREQLDRAEDQKLLDILAEVISKAESWADESPAATTAGSTPHPFHEKIRKAYGQHELYQQYRPVASEASRRARRQVQSDALDASRPERVPRRN
jgi:hypothetical protein